MFSQEQLRIAIGSYVYNTNCMLLGRFAQWEELSRSFSVKTFLVVNRS